MRALTSVWISFFSKNSIILALQGKGNRGVGELKFKCPESEGEGAGGKGLDAIEFVGRFCEAFLGKKEALCGWDAHMYSSSSTSFFHLSGLDLVDFMNISDIQSTRGSAITRRQARFCC